MTYPTSGTMTFLCAAGLVLTLASPATAQDTAAGGPPASLRPIELSLCGAGVLSWATSGVSIRAMVTIPVGERRSLEIFGGPYQATRNQEFVDDVRAFYGVQTRRRIDRGSRPGFELFLSSGVEGVVWREPSYSCSAPGCVRPPRTYILPPLIAMFGFGAQKTLSPHAALRVEAQGLIALVVPVGVRLGVSLSVPIGQVFEAGKQGARK